MIQEKLINVANMLNKKAEFEILSVPIIDNFKIKDNNLENVIFQAVGEDNSSEILICDGKLKENESFDERLNKVLSEIIETNKSNEIENSNNNIYFYTKFMNKLEYYIYIIDYVKLVGVEKRVIRQINAFFLEPTYNNFYQLSLNTAPFLMPTKILKLGENFDLEKDEITRNLVNILINIIKGIEYK